MVKRNTFLMVFFLIFALQGVAFAASCEGLLASVEEARKRYLQDDLLRQQETTLKPPASISEELSCFGDFTAGIDVSKYDPASIMSVLKNMAGSIQDKACQAAKGYLDSNLNQISGSLNSAGQLPYGLGTLYDTRMSTSGVSVTGNTPSAGSISSNLPGTSSLPKVPLPF
jgi:hypothetical protein